MYLRKPGPKPGALAFKNYRPGQKTPQAKHRARLGPAFFGLAWPGFWPQARAGTSLLTGLSLISHHDNSTTTTQLQPPRSHSKYTMTTTTTQRGCSRRLSHVSSTLVCFFLLPFFPNLLTFIYCLINHHNDSTTHTVRMMAINATTTITTRQRWH